MLFRSKGKEVIVLIILAAASIPSFYVVVFDNSIANHCELVITYVAAMIAYNSI